MKKSNIVAPALLAVLLAPTALFAACPSAAEVNAYVEDVKAVRANLTFGSGENFSIEDGQCARRMLIERLPEALGPRVGYKAQFTHDANRAIWGVEEPIWGAMFGKYLMASPAKVSYKYGAVTYWEADLIFEVKDTGLADARTQIEALRHLSAVIPFIPLRDLVNPTYPRIQQYTATNAGVRGGVLGEKIPVKSSRQFLNALANMTVEVSDDGKLQSQVKGNAILNGNPVNAVMWLAQTLKKNGIELKPGDLLGVGAITNSSSPRQGASIKVTYKGLPGNPSVAVEFE